MKRLLLSLTLAAAALACAWFAVPSRDADAVAAADVQGVYLLKLKGDGWVKGPSVNGGRFRASGLRGQAYLLVGLVNADDNDGQVTVEVRLAQTLEGSVLDQATGSPDFVGRGYLVGDTLAVIDSGASIFVNALTLRFTKGGRVVAGNWMVAKPATALDGRDGSFAAAATVALKGKLVRVKPGRPAPTIPPAATDAFSTAR